MLEILTAWRTGHEGGAATIHSNIASPIDALERVEDMLLQANPTPMPRMIGKTIGLVVCLQSRAWRPSRDTGRVRAWVGRAELPDQAGGVDQPKTFTAFVAAALVVTLLPNLAHAAATAGGAACRIRRPDTFKTSVTGEVAGIICLVGVVAGVAAYLYQGVLDR